jgi:hypothetical protein
LHSATWARDAGYASYHNLSDALKRRTGLRPGAARGLSDDQVSALARKQLSLRPDRFDYVTTPRAQS